MRYKLAVCMHLDSCVSCSVQIQQMTDKHTKSVDELLQTKSTELMNGS